MLSEKSYPLRPTPLHRQPQGKQTQENADLHVHPSASARKSAH